MNQTVAKINDLNRRATYKFALQGALRTALILFSGLFIGLFTGDTVFNLIPGSDVDDIKLGHAAIAAVPALAAVLGSSTFWGVQMGRLAGVSSTRRMALAGLLGFGPITIVLVVGLGAFEPAIVESLSSISIHRIFTLLFVPSAFLIAGVSAFAIGWGLKDGRLALSLFWQVGLAAAVAFLVINLTMESLGWVIGAPGALERTTMLKVMAIGNLGAALVGGSLLGIKLANYKKETRNKAVL